MMKRSDSGKAVAYVRCSTEEQRESGLGLEAQCQAITETAAELGLTIRGWFDDEGRSGGLDIYRRPGLLGAIGAIRRGDALIIAKLDRLARDVDIAGEIRMLLRRRGARVVSCAAHENGDGAAGMIVTRMSDFVSEQYRLAVSEKTKAALAVLRRKGLPISKFPPYGWELRKGKWVKCLHEQQAIELARDLRSKGHSLRDCCAILTRRGFYNRAGGPFRYETLRKALQR